METGDEQTRRPAGIPLGRAFDIPHGILYDDLRQAVAATDLVHGDGELPQISVRLIGGLSARGQFRFNDVTGQPENIVLRLHQNDRAFIFLHEVGHLLDLCGLGEGKQFGSVAGPGFGAWGSAVEESNAFRDLWHLAHEGLAEIIESDGTRRRSPLTQPQQMAVRRLLVTDELWARSYAQYVAIRSRHPLLTASLDRMRTRQPGEVYYPMQWATADFVPIAEAIDEMFAREGWRV